MYSIIYEKAIWLYRVLLPQILPEKSRARLLIKKITYSIGLFQAKRRGFLPYFFNSKEIEYMSLDLNQQYQVGSSNCIPIQYSTMSFDIRKYQISITAIVIFNNYIAEHVRKTLDSLILQMDENVEIIVICPKKDEENIDKELRKKMHPKASIVFFTDNELDAVLRLVISKSNADYFIIIENYSILKPDYLTCITAEINKKTDLDVIYADEDIVSDDGKICYPIFKPDWSPYLLLSLNYLGNVIVYRREFLKTIIANENFSDDSIQYYLALNILGSSAKISHISHILYSNILSKNPEENIHNTNKEKIILESFLDKKEIQAKIELRPEGFFVMRPNLKNQPLVSIIIPTKDNIKQLSKCLEDITKSSYESYEIILVSNSTKKDTLDFLHSTGHKIIEYKQLFNFSKVNNLASIHANGEYLIFLNDDTRIINIDWIENLLIYAMQENVGVVGALLLFPESPFYKTSIQHGGVTLGVGGPATHSFSYSPYVEKKYLNYDRIVRDVSAVTAACMMIKKSVFNEVNGFDEVFTIAFGDTDLCLRILQRGYQIIYNPNVVLYHYESVTRGVNNPLHDEISFLNRWEDLIIKGDEFYNSNLSHLNRNFIPSPYFFDNAPLSTLFEIYYFRKDLQKRFFGDKKLTELIDWAATEGITSDISRNALISYNKYYLENSTDNVKKLAYAIYQFNHDIKMQLSHPEVLRGKYDKLLTSYTRKVEK